METIKEEEDPLATSHNMEGKKGQVQELFLLCDTERRGYVTINDLQHLRQELGLSAEQIRTVFAHLDKDNNGYLTFDEFEEGLVVFLKQSNRHLEFIDSRPKKNCYTKRKMFRDSYYERIASCSSTTEILELLRDSENGKEFWNFIQAEHPELVPHFEDFLASLATEHNKLKEESVVLQDSFNKKSLAYEQQIQALYEEMEAQLQKEREDILLKKSQLEKQLREELQEASNAKDQDSQDLLEKWFLAERELQTARELRLVTSQENQKLLQEKEQLKYDLEIYQRKMTDLRLQLEQAREDNLVDKRQHYKSAFQLSEKIAWEREALDKQLSLLRTINKRLVDDSDEMANAEVLGSTPFAPVTTNTEMLSKNLSDKRGSVMADYFGISPNNFESFDDDVFNGSFDMTKSQSGTAPLCLVHPNNHTSRPNSVINTFDINKNKTSRNPLSSMRTSSNESDKKEELLLPQFFYKVVFIGDSAVGKTSLINKICNVQFKETIGTTIGVDFRTRNIVCDDRVIVLQIWDTAGQERFRSITCQYMRRSDVVVVVYDVTSEASYSNVASWMSSIDDVHNLNTLIVLIGNKIDSEYVKLTTNDGERLAMDKNALFFETSAKTGVGIDELISTLASKLQTGQRDNYENNSVMKLTCQESQQKPKKKTCC